MFDGLVVNRGNLALLSNAKTRSISSENSDGKKGGGGRTVVSDESGTGGSCARDLGTGWKVSPWSRIGPGETYTLADIEGPGCIQSMWMTVGLKFYRDAILRIYWDGQEQPSVVVPLADFFASAWTGTKTFAQLTSEMVCMNPGRAFNCYWPMPFRKHCRITIENRNPVEEMRIFYQINYALNEVPDDAAYFHAQFRRVNPLPYKKVYTILDGVRGQGHYAGTYMAWGLNNQGWWGEGEIKFYMDGDIPAGRSVDDAVAEHGGDCYPTICGTGTEDYFCGSYNFENAGTGQYQEYCGPYAGVPHVYRPDGVYNSQTRFSMYRWHVPDPIRFESDLAVTMQALGWRSEGRYLPLQDDIASVAYWYQTLPTAPFPELGDRDALEII